MPTISAERATGGDPLPDESLVVGDQLGFVAADASADLREGKRIGVDALHHRQEIPPPRLRRLGAGDARVFQDASEEESALRRSVAAVADRVVRARLAECSVDGAPSVAGELRGDSCEVAPAGHVGGWRLAVGGWRLAVGG